MPTHDEIYQKVQATLVDALGVDEEDVTKDSTLQGDLGAESIDFLDIVFRLEREFGVKIPRGELFPESVFQGDPEFVNVIPPAEYLSSYVFFTDPTYPETDLVVVRTLGSGGFAVPPAAAE